MYSAYASVPSGAEPARPGLRAAHLGVPSTTGSRTMFSREAASTSWSG